MIDGWYKKFSVSKITVLIMIQVSYITVFYKGKSLFIIKLWTTSSIWKYFCAAGAPKANVKGRVNLDFKVKFTLHLSLFNFCLPDLQEAACFRPRRSLVCLSRANRACVPPLRSSLNICFGSTSCTKVLPD